MQSLLDDAGTGGVTMNRKCLNRVFKAKSSWVIGLMLLLGPACVSAQGEHALDERILVQGEQAAQDIIEQIREALRHGQWAGGIEEPVEGRVWAQCCQVRPPVQDCPTYLLIQCED